MKHVKRLLLVLAALCLLVCVAVAAETPMELYEELMENLQAQKEAFVIEYTGDITDLYDEDGSPYTGAELVRGMAANIPNDHGNGADTLMMNLMTASCGFDKDNRLHFTAKYLLTPEKIDWVQGKAKLLVKDLKLRGEPDFMKVKKIYEYVCTNFTYDKTLTKFTDYDGLTTGSMVCQGYALLIYRMMWEAGIPCRIVVGTSRGEAHGWNIVQVDGEWYNLDATWDSVDAQGGVMAWDYFMKAQINFVTHERNQMFLTKQFQQLHPISPKSFEMNKLKVLVEGTAYSNLIFRNGKELDLGVDASTSSRLTWSSSNPAAVSVDANGHIVSIAPGEAIISVTAEDPTWLPGQLYVTAIDMRTCSPWAEEELSSYYLRSLYPAELCADYQNPITREELAHLVYQMLSRYGNIPGRHLAPDFRDISSSPYWFSITHVAARRIMEGNGDQRFYPKETVTREMAAKVLVEMLHYMQKLPELATDAAAFTDMDAVSEWAKEHVKASAQLNIWKGDGSGAFHPQDLITREQTAMVIERIFLQYIEPTLEQAAS